MICEANTIGDSSIVEAKKKNTSYYGCLCNYGNEVCHDELTRAVVIEFWASMPFRRGYSLSYKLSCNR